MITIEKAITDLHARVDGEFYIKGADRCEDIKLAIKALDRFRGLRAAGHYVGMPLLKGEKKE